MTVAVIDSGVANLESVMGALRRLQAEAVVTNDAAIIEKASHVILPGVGAAVAAMDRLREKKLVDVLPNLTKPVLGICLGMQILFEHSLEGNNVKCLGIIKGAVGRLAATPDRPVPHMGWNTLQIKQPQHPLVKKIADQSYVYFVHSFAASVSDSTVALTNYGAPFSAVVSYKNFMGCQFHPERSGVIGSQILENFLSL